VYELDLTSVDEDNDEESLDPDSIDPEGHPDWTGDSSETAPSHNIGRFKSLEEEHSARFLASSDANELGLELVQ